MSSGTGGSIYLGTKFIAHTDAASDIYVGDYVFITGADGTEYRLRVIARRFTIRGDMRGLTILTEEGS